MRNPRALRFTLLLLGVLLSSCATVPVPESRAVASTRPPVSRQTAEVQRKLAEGAHYVLGKKELVVRGRRFHMDCTGTVLAIYWYAGIDLARDFPKFSGNGVTRLYRSLEKKNLLYSSPYPLAGDIIFWDNTYDRNLDGRWNDPLTHVGMVLEAGLDGSIVYVHLNYSKGIVLEHMSLLEPNVNEKLVKGEVRIVNSPIRLKSPGRPHPPLWLAGQLYRVLGMGYLF
jgi:hypothetical protein